MKVEIVKSEPVPPPEDKVVITLAQDEARILRSLTFYSSTIPKALRLAGLEDTERIKALLSALYLHLTEVGVRL